MHLPYKPYLKKYSQTNRKIPTKSEGLVWNMLLKGDRTGYRFLRQKPIEGYILDFYCPKLKLAIEIDGESHEGKGDYDEERDRILKNIGIRILKYRDEDIHKKLDAVSIDIYAEIEQRAKIIGLSKTKKK